MGELVSLVSDNFGRMAASGHMPFILGSYVIGVGGTAALALWAYGSMRKAERDAGKLGRGE